MSMGFYICIDKFSYTICYCENTKPLNSIDQISKDKVNAMIRKTILLLVKVKKENIANKNSKYHKQIEDITQKLFELGKKNDIYKAYYKNILINNRDAKAKGIVALILIDLKDEAIPNMLLSLLNDSDPEVRAIAIYCLKDLRYLPAESKLIEIEKSDPNNTVKDKAIITLNAFKEYKKKDNK